jgi:hypothetical protein
MVADGRSLGRLPGASFYSGSFLFGHLCLFCVY